MLDLLNVSFHKIRVHVLCSDLTGTRRYIADVWKKMREGQKNNTWLTKFRSFLKKGYENMAWWLFINTFYSPNQVTKLVFLSLSLIRNGIHTPSVEQTCVTRRGPPGSFPAETLKKIKHTTWNSLDRNMRERILLTSTQVLCVSQDNKNKIVFEVLGSVQFQSSFVKYHGFTHSVNLV